MKTILLSIILTFHIFAQVDVIKKYDESTGRTTITTNQAATAQGNPGYNFSYLFFKVTYDNIDTAYVIEADVETLFNFYIPIESKVTFQIDWNLTFTFYTSTNSFKNEGLCKNWIDIPITKSFLILIGKSNDVQFKIDGQNNHSEYFFLYKEGIELAKNFTKEYVK